MPHVKPLKAQSGELLHLDLMRFVASVGIVLHHSKEFLYPLAEREASKAESFGLALFVDLFFVISGYVITYVYADRMHDLADYGDFLRRRIGRLAPLQWLTLACAVVLWSVLLKLGVSANHVPSYRPGCMVATIALVHAGYACESFNGQSWSISAEMAMYVLFPLFAWLSSRSRYIPLALGGVIFFCLLFIGDGNLLESARQWSWLQAYLRAAPSFLIGVGLWYGRSALRAVPAPGWLLACFTVTLVLAMCVGAPALLTMLLVYATVALAAAADLAGRPSAFVQRTAPLGQLTYSIYMWHTLFIMVFLNGLGDKLLHGRAYVIAPLMILTYAALGLFSVLSLQGFKTPARRWIDGLDLSSWQGVAHRSGRQPERQPGRNAAATNLVGGALSKKR